MGETYGTVAAIMLSVYMMFILPLNNMLYENEKLEQMYIVNEITYFVEQARNTGSIDKSMYLSLEKNITGLNNRYNIMITHYKSIYNEDRSEIIYFGEENYLWNIKETLEKNDIYNMSRNEYIKVSVSDGEKMVACYGGGIKNEGETPE